MIEIESVIVVFCHCYAIGFVIYCVNLFDLYEFYEWRIVKNTNLISILFYFGTVENDFEIGYAIFVVGDCEIGVDFWSAIVRFHLQDKTLLVFK